MSVVRQVLKRQHPNSGVRLDFENLLKKFTESETVRYEKFAEVWRTMKFSMLSAGRQNDREVREFLDECLHIALSYYLPPYNFQVRVGGLYLLYGLYFTQLCFPNSKIRVSPVQWKQILEFQEDAQSQQHLDVEFCFEKLLFKHAFLFVATPKEVYPRSTDAVENIASTEMSEELKESQGCLETLFSSELLEQLSAVHTNYEKIKIDLAGPDAERPDRSLDMIQSKLVSNILSRLEMHNEKLIKLKQQMQQKRSLLDMSDDEDPTCEPSVSTAAKLKAKAFSGLVKQTRSRRHRKSVLDDSMSPDKSPQKSSKKVTYRMPSDLPDEEEGQDDDSLVKQKPMKDLLPMPSLSTEKEHSSKKEGKKKKQLKGKQSSAVTLGEKQKHKNKSPKKEKTKKGGKKGIHQKSEREKKGTKKTKKLKQDIAANVLTDEIVENEDKQTAGEMSEVRNDVDLPSIKKKPRKPRKPKVGTISKKDISKKVSETVSYVDKNNELEVGSDTSLSSAKKRGRPKKQQATVSENEFFFDKNKKLEVGNDTDLSSPKKKGRPKKQRDGDLNNDKNKEVGETASENDTSVKDNEFELGSDLAFSSPKRKRGRRNKESIGETEMTSDTDLPSPKKKQRRSLETKISAELDDSKTSQNTDTAKKKCNTPKKESRETNVPRQRPVPVQKKEQSSKKRGRPKKDLPS